MSPLHCRCSGLFRPRRIAVTRGKVRHRSQPGFSRRAFYDGLSTARRPMTHRKIVSIVLLFLAAPLIAQKVATGMRHIKKPEQNGSVTVAFDPTPVGSTETLTCGYNCFYQLNADACDYSGMITLVKTAAVPFGVTNLRKGTIAAINANDCSRDRQPSLSAAGVRIGQCHSHSDYNVYINSN